METDAKAINVRILDKDYLIGCPPEEREGLLAAARFLDGRMRETRDSGKVIGTERIAVIAALNIAHELLQKQESLDRSASSFDQGIRQITRRIEEVLGDNGSQTS